MYTHMISDSSISCQESDVSYDAMSEDDRAKNAETLYFAYMIANYVASQKINTYIGKSRDPFIKLDMINQKKAKGAKSTRQAAGHWNLEMIVGPFLRKDESAQFRELWKQKSRGIPSRRQRGKDLAGNYNKICWDASVLQGGEAAPPSDYDTDTMAF